jgi:hypothetical protein
MAKIVVARSAVPAAQEVSMLRIVGPLLLILGLLGLALGAFQYTRQKTVLDVGPLQLHANTKETVTIPPLLAGGVAVVGAVLTVASLGRRR